MKKIVVIGGTSGIAHACMRIWNQNAVEITLVVRDTDKGQLVVNDLQARNPDSIIRLLEADFLDPKRIHSTVQSIEAEGAPDIVFIAHGSLPDQQNCEENLGETQAALIINGVSPVLFAEAFVSGMLKRDHGQLAVIGSVAGDRGRKSNYVYGSAKGLVARYLQGMQHRLVNTNVNIVLIKPGPTLSPMTYHLASEGATGLASPEEVASVIVKGMEKGKSVIYAPKKWQLIMLVIMHIPAFIFKKINI
jgi:decaprenylphospho-beta-D-erythro-pentofuranosid-2-ulose 2-reductase